MDNMMDDLANEGEANRSSKNLLYANPRLPLDLGFTNLGLLMQLTAGFFLAYIVMLLTIFGSIFPGLILLISLLRSVAHGICGRFLVHGNPASRVAVKVYMAVSLAQLLVILGAVGNVNFSGVLAIAIVLMSWPLALFWITERQEAKDYYALEYTHRHPKGGDQGIKGTGTLMIVLGASGLAIASWLFYSLLSSGVLRSGIVGILVILTCGIMVARAWTHVSRGNDCCRHPVPGTFQGALKNYMGISLASACAFVLTVFVGMSMTRGWSSPSLSTVFCVVFLMLLWPLLLSDRRSLLGGGDDWDDFDAVPPPVPDEGLTALGFLLLGTGVVSVSFHLAIFIASPEYSSAFSTFSTGDTWLNFGLGLLTLWAGFELVTMSERFRMAATCYGVVGSLLAMWNVVQTFSHVGGKNNPVGGQSGVMVVFMLAISLVMPLSTFLMARRSLPSDVDDGFDP